MKTKIPSIIKNEKLGALLIILTAALLRLHTNFSTEYIGGNNGAFYLVLVRSAMENGELKYIDFPLLFHLEAIIAFIPYKLGLASPNSAIDITSRLFDSVIPPLSFIPAFLIVKKLIKNEEERLAVIIFASVSVFYFSFMVLVSDFQKNSLGLLWLFWLVYYLLRIHEKSSTKNYLLAALFFVLTSLTHYGCTAVALTVVALDLLVKYSLRMSIKKFVKGFLLVLIVTIAALGLVYLASKWRFETFIEIPIEIFREPIITFLILGKPVLSSFDLLNLVLVNAAALVSFYLYLKNFQNIELRFRPFLLTMILLSFFLASPFLGLYAAQRLYFISYLTTLPLLPFIYKQIKTTKRKKYLPIGIFLLLVLSVIAVKSKPQQSNMNRETYSEMLKLEIAIPKHERSLIVARHGMEFWSEWIFRVDAIREEALTPNYWVWYGDVHFLVQKKNKPDFGPAGLFGPRFPEPVLPDSAFLVKQTEFFDLYRSPVPPNDFSIFKQRR